MRNWWRAIWLLWFSLTLGFALILCTAAVRYFVLPSERPVRTMKAMPSQHTTDDAFLSITREEFVGWVHDLEHHYLIVSKIYEIYSAYYTQNRPRSGSLDLMRLAEQRDENYWENYHSRIGELQSWCNGQKRQIDSIKAFARTRFPKIHFQRVDIPPQAPAPRYPTLPSEALLDLEYAPSPPPRGSWREARED
jgi:hypothetical protein